MTPETLPPYQLITQYRAYFLRHEPQRYARMLPPEEAEQAREKYHDVSGRLTDENLFEQLIGGQSFAVPWEANGLAHMLPLDIDSGGLPAIQTLLAECRRRGLWAFGHYTPRAGADEADQHGYVFVPFSDLENVARIQRLGDELLQSVATYGWKIENRAHGADTRLPFTYHQVNRTWGELILLEERIALASSPAAVLQHLFAIYQENPVELLPPPPPAPQRKERQRPAGDSIDITRFNEEHELTDLLEYYGARRVAKGLYLCPFHDDRRASLGVYVRHGKTYCHCLSRNSDCALSVRGRNDAFNVYCIGERLTTEEALRKLNSRNQ